MKKECKKHIHCQFKGKGKHEGCRWHGIVDSCTDEPPFRLATPCNCSCLNAEEIKRRERAEHFDEAMDLARASLGVMHDKKIKEIKEVLEELLKKI